MILNGDRGTNVTPNNVAGQAVDDLMDICDQHLRGRGCIRGQKVVGIGKYAEKRAVLPSRLWSLNRNMLAPLSSLPSGK